MSDIDQKEIEGPPEPSEPSRFKDSAQLEQKPVIPVQEVNKERI